jgi:hypothetical protein
LVPMSTIAITAYLPLVESFMTDPSRLHQKSCNQTPMLC